MENNDNIDRKETIVETVPARSPGNYSIPEFTLEAGSSTSLVPKGESYFDVAYNEAVDVTYYANPNNPISVMVATSTPSIYYDPDCNSGVTQSFTPKVSGQYKVYMKSYSTEDTKITGGSIKIYELN